MPTHADPRVEVATACRVLARNGCESGVAGQVTERIPGRDGFLVSALEHFDLARPEAVAEHAFSVDATALAADPTVSPAANFLAVMYAERPDIGAIVHIHSHWVSVMCATGREVGQYNVAACLFFEDQALHEDDGTFPSLEGKHMLAALGGRHTLWLKNHGVVVLADTLENATIKALTLEMVAQHHLEAEFFGATETATAEVLRVKAAYERSYLPAMWTSNVRRLRESDPDLFDAR